MGPRFRIVDRDTPMLLPPDLREWVAEDDLVHFVIAAVDRLPLSHFTVNYKGTGDRQYPPHMMLALLIYSYANGVVSSRRIERATHRDLAVRYLCADTHPDHDTISTFRRKNLAAVTKAFVDVLELARDLKLLKLGTIALDGTHMKANASIDQNVTYERAVQLREQLELDTQELLGQAENADQEEDPQQLPKEIARREKLHAKMDVDGSRMIVSQHVSQSASDSVELENGVKHVPAELGRPTAVLADAGYVNSDAIQRLEQEMEVYVSVCREDAHSERRYDYRPKEQSERPVKKVSDPRLIKMKEKLSTPEGKALYAQRNQTVEPVFGVIKSAMGIRGFQLRGKAKVTGEWTLICLSYNLKRLHVMKQAQAA